MFAPSRFGCRSVPALTASSPRSGALISVSGRSLCLTPSKPIRWSPRPTFWWGRKMKMTTIFNPACDKYVVIMYNYIFDERPDRRGIHPRAPADFERELDFLAAHYQVVGTPLEVLAAARQGGPPTAALTFDDATRDQYENAAPRLEAHGLRGNFFVLGETLAGRLPFTHQLHLLF